MKSFRRFHAYCIGTSKSGTHSIAGLFQPEYKSAHEPEHYKSIQLLLTTGTDEVDDKQLEEMFAYRDQRLGLELESSNLLSFFPKVISDGFPDAKFILTIRDCYSWLDSCLNHQLNAKRSEDMAYWWRYRDFCFCSEFFNHAPQEKILAQHHLYTLDGYLSYWKMINEMIITTIPSERLLIIRTSEIEESLNKISHFLQIPVDTLNSSASHLYKARRKYGFLWQIDEDFLEKKMDFYCRDIMNQYFPNVKNLNQALVR